MRERIKERLRRWMQRVPGPEPQPIRLAQSRIYVLPSATGMTLALTLLVMLIASINYSLSLGFLLVFLLVGVAAAHLLQSWRGLMGLEIRARALGEAFAQGKAGFEIEFSDALGRERPGIVVRALSETAQVDVPARGSARATLQLPATHRGLMQLPRLTLETRMPLGWIRAWTYVMPDAMQWIFPMPHGELSCPTSGGARAGEGSRNSPGNDEFGGLREWQASDPPRRIAWKQLARDGVMRSKFFTGGGGPNWLLDWQAMPTHLDGEARLSQLTRWVLAARAGGHVTTLVLPGLAIGPGHDGAHHLACLRALAEFGRPSGGATHV